MRSSQREKFEIWLAENHEIIDANTEAREIMWQAWRGCYQRETRRGIYIDGVRDGMERAAEIVEDRMHGMYARMIRAELSALDADFSAVSGPKIDDQLKDDAEREI